ncbi:hypothetical protein ACWD04_30720 [Streptomyces sp. NPDC002911]
MTGVRAPRGTFSDASPAADRLDLLTPPVADVVATGWGGAPAESAVYVETAPEIADTAVSSSTAAPNAG